MSGRLNHTPADVIRFLLISAGYGTNPSVAGAWPIHIANLADDPDNIISIRDTTGRIQAHLQIGGEMVERPGIQIMVRSSKKKEATIKINDIANYLDGLSNTSLTITDPDSDESNYTIHDFSRTSGIIYAGYEKPASRRKLFTTNGTMCLTLN